MNDDLHTSGRRSSDNGALTLREALDLFTPKTETAALASTLSLVASQVAALPSRAELKTHWDLETERYQRLETRVDDRDKEHRQALEKIDGKVDTLLADRLPRWVWPTTVIVLMVVGILATHFWK